jgi:hypothetical protein
MVLLTAALGLTVSLSVSPVQDINPSNRGVRVTSGVVKNVTPTDVTVKVGDDALTFKIDTSTSVIVRGDTHTNDLVYRGPYRPRRISDFIKTGDNVRVRYRQIDDALLAVELQVTTKRTTR